jgi:hypothetical protein
MRQKLLGLSLAISLLPFIAALTIAARSYFWWKYDGITFNSVVASSGRQTHYCISVRPFSLTVSHHRLVSGSLRPGWLPFSGDCSAITMVTFDKWYQDLGGFGFGGIGVLPGVARPDGCGWIYEASFPHWMLIPVSALVPALLVRRLHSAKRHALGACPACGYDLRATPDRCPECGGARKKG